MIRRYGEQVRRGQRYRLRVGVYAILERGGDLLLTCKEDDPSDIQLPGGGVDPGVLPEVDAVLVDQVHNAGSVEQAVNDRGIGPDDP